MMGETALLSMLDMRGVVDAGPRNKTPTEDRSGSSYGGSREQLTPAAEGRGGRSHIEGPGQLTPSVEPSGGNLRGEGHEQVTPAVEDQG